MFRQIQSSNLTTTEIVQSKHSLNALLHTMQQAEVNGRFGRLESKMDDMESKLDSSIRTNIVKFASLEMGQQSQAAETATLLAQSTQQVKNIEKLNALLGNKPEL